MKTPTLRARTMCTLAVFAAVLTSLSAAADAHQYAITSQNKSDESKAYKEWYEAFKGQDYDRAGELAKQHLQVYPNGVCANYLKKWLESAGKQILTGQTPLDHLLEALAIAATESNWGQILQRLRADVRLQGQNDHP